MDILHISKNILHFWFESESDPFNKLWFQKDKSRRETLDNYIENRYYSILTIFQQMSLSDIINNDLSVRIASIICLDQFSRHIYRSANYKNKICQSSESYDISESNKLIRENTSKAANLSLYSCLSDDFAYYQKLLPFVLMPLKHDNIFKYFPVIHKKTIEVHKNLGNLPEFMSKFYFDSLTKYLSDESQCKAICTSSIDDRIDYNKQILATVCEYLPDVFEYNNVLTKSNKLYSTIDQFIKRLMMRESIIHNKLIILSLSGGPDSMVLLYILSKVITKYDITVEAFHINYKNRNESDKEEDLVAYWCKCINIKLHIYRFPFIRRKDTDRDYYEKITRKVRFNLYRHFNAPIVLGHIAEDLIENIWTNISKGTDLFRLHKITEISHQDNVDILRPFHRTNKKDIYEFAHTYNIPYLKDTTPMWSNRGKFRKVFKPAIESQFGECIHDKLLYLSDSIESYHNLLDKMIFSKIFKSVKYHKFGLIVNMQGYRDMGLHFWHHILMKLIQNLNIESMSIKSVKNFVEFIQQSDDRVGVIHLRKDIDAYIDNSTNIHILLVEQIKNFLEKDHLYKKDYLSLTSQIVNYIH